MILMSKAFIDLNILLAPGETGDIAEEMAARDALRRLYRFDDAANPFPLGKALNLIIPSVIEDKINVKSLSS